MSQPQVLPNLPKTYKKYVVHKLSNNFEEATKLETCETAHLLASLPPDGVIIRHHFCGINASDPNYTAGRYNPKVKPPFDCGFEAIGEIVAIGSAVKRRKLRQPVAVMSYGAFAELQLVRDREIIPIASLTPEQVPLLVSGLTAQLALKHAGRNPQGETVLVTAAAGGAGQMAVQIAKLGGNRLIGTCSSDEKATILKELGCDRVINYRKESIDSVLKEEYPKGVDVVFESVGGETLQQCLNNLATRGRLIIIGAISAYSKPVPEGAKSSTFAGVWTDTVSTVSLLQKSQSVNGFFLNHYAREFGAALNDMSYAVADGKLKPIVETKDFRGIESIPAAIHYLHEGKNIGKVVVPLQAAFDIQKAKL
ncbi:Prostaglandin reductase 3 [Rhizophlyctis rosea]|uniref:Prostaglandin reductase 3 n=1 Tax=Rhizophlyctis rosea TaxID=64517 RepID=A0AAD5XAD7_9FUNG|nr:Prostaglandin reductase 3 [Rhizophlyctis rosea]